MDRVESLYFDWLVDLVCDDVEKFLYEALLEYLFEQDFEWIRPMDENCAVYGLMLRDRFYKSKPSRQRLANADSNLRFKKCSILELIISLADKMETDVMSNDYYGDRTGYWFWMMIDNLGLRKMENKYFNVHRADRIIDNFINRRYEKNGKGGLFVIDDRYIDMRECDIWQQSMGFLGRFAEENGEIW